MKTLFVVVFVVMMISCSKQNEVTNIGQLAGIWQWESSCGGIISGCCAYPSTTLYKEIDFYANGQYVHKTNGHIDLKADYTIEKKDDKSGTLVLNVDTAIYTEYYTTPLEMQIDIRNNRLSIYQGELIETYVKIK